MVDSPDIPGDQIQNKPSNAATRLAERVEKIQEAKKARQEEHLATLQKMIQQAERDPANQQEIARDQGGVSGEQPALLNPQIADAKTSPMHIADIPTTVMEAQRGTPGMDTNPERPIVFRVDQPKENSPVGTAGTSHAA